MEILFQWRNAIASDNGPLSPITRLVLLVLSLPMVPNGLNCFLSVRKIATMTGLSLQTVVTHINIAVKGGWLIKKLKGFSGQGWRHHQYEPAIPEGVQRGGTPYNEKDGKGVQADGTRMAEGVKSDIAKVFKEVEPNTTNNTPRKINTTKGAASDPSPPAVNPSVHVVSKKKSKAKRRHKTALPADFVLTPALREFAVAKGFSGDVDSLFDACCDHYRGNGKQWVDWSAVWRNWVRREIKFQKEKNDGKHRGSATFKGNRRTRSGAGNCPPPEPGKYAGFSKELPNDG